MEALIFEVNGQRLAVRAGNVQQVVRACTITPLPGAPSIVEGLIDLHGELVPVLDLRARFSLPAKPLGPEEHFIVATAGARRVALRADRALALAELADGAVAELAAAIPGTRHIAGVARLEDGLVLLHDLLTFLTEAESEELDRALPPPGLGPSTGVTPEVP